MDLDELKIVAELAAEFVDVPTGERGDKGDRGEAGPRGEKGEKGDKGDRGDVGPKGDAGRDGKDGHNGKDGSRGETGRSGADGKQGLPGSPGERGLAGPKGDKGDPGIDGANGRDGEPGKDGVDGRDGIDGRDGRDGEPGVDGKDGRTGDRGPIGPRGYDGTPGEKGDQGDAGPGLPPGGEPGMILQKHGKEDFKARWARLYVPTPDPNSGGGGGGKWGTITGNLSDQADLNSALLTIDGRLDALEYKLPVVQSISNTVNTVEIGTTISSLTLNWTLNKTVTSQSFNSGIGSISPALRTLALSGLSLTSDITYTLTVGDGTNSANGSTGVSFRNRRRWGVSSVVTPNSALIDALAGAEFATNYSQSRSMSPSAQYLYFAWPSSFGATPTFTVNGLPVTGWTKTTISYTNPSGYTTNFDVWQSQYTQTGTFSVVVS